MKKLKQKQQIESDLVFTNENFTEIIKVLPEVINTYKETFAPLKNLWKESNE